MSNAPHLKVNGSHAHHLLGILSGNPPDGIVQHSARRGQTESFFNLDLPIKYAPDPKLHGLKWRHKLPTNHLWTDLSQGTRSTWIQTPHTAHSKLTSRSYIILFSFNRHTHIQKVRKDRVSEAVLLYCCLKQWCQCCICFTQTAADHDDGGYGGHMWVGPVWKTEHWWVFLNTHLHVLLLCSSLSHPHLEATCEQWSAAQLEEIQKFHQGPSEVVWGHTLKLIVGCRPSSVWFPGRWCPAMIYGNRCCLEGRSEKSRSQWKLARKNYRSEKSEKSFLF